MRLKKLFYIVVIFFLAVAIVIAVFIKNSPKIQKIYYDNKKKIVRVDEKWFVKSVLIINQEGVDTLHYLCFHNNQRNSETFLFEGANYESHDFFQNELLIRGCIVEVIALERQDTLNSSFFCFNLNEECGIIESFRLFP